MVRAEMTANHFVRYVFFKIYSVFSSVDGWLLCSNAVDVGKTRQCTSAPGDGASACQGTHLHVPTPKKMVGHFHHLQGRCEALEPTPLAQRALNPVPGSHSF